MAASSTALDEDELVALVCKLKPAYRANGAATWIMNSTTAGAVRQFKDSQGRFLWAEGLAPGQPAMLLGYRVIEAEDMPDIATGQAPIASGNFRRGYLVVDRIGTQLIADMVTTPGLVKLYFARRTGGAVADSNAIKLLEMA